MTNAEAETAARAAGLAYQALQFTGAPPPGVVAEVAALLDQRPGPVLAYCRTGARSLTAWAMAQALCGARAPDEIIALAKNAGYDLAGIRGVLARLAPS
jgi:sulfide:quinone oxidoreductase